MPKFTEVSKATTFIISISLIIFLFIQEKESLIQLFSKTEFTFILTTSIALVTTTLFSVNIFYFLQDKNKDKDKNKNVSYDLQFEIIKIRSEFEKQLNDINTKQDKETKNLNLQLKQLVNDIRNEKILEKVVEKINPKVIKQEIDKKINTIGEKHIIDLIDNKYGKEIIKETNSLKLEGEYSKIRVRIYNEITRLNKVSIVNLSLGFITTFMAIFFMAYSLINLSPQNETPLLPLYGFVYQFIPRISLAILIEIFSFFFLKMYKKNLDDIKYLNNEITNVELKILALKSSLIIEDYDSTKKILFELATTERNFILQKDESTVEIQKAKLDTENNSQVMLDLLKILNNSEQK